MSEAIYDEKVQTILTYLKEGKTKEEISELYNQEWKTIYIYMNRKGFRWDSNQETFVEKVAEVKDTQRATVEHTKAAQVIRMFEVKHPNIKKIAVKQGFQTVEELGQYMKSQGYIWDDEQSNYVEDVQVEVTNQVEHLKRNEKMDEHQFINFLLQHQDKLLELLSGESTTSLMTYKFKGSKAQKTLSLASSAAILIEDYSKEFNMTQRIVVETALAEFFERHGYKERLKAVTI